MFFVARGDGGNVSYAKNVLPDTFHARPTINRIQTLRSEIKARSMPIHRERSGGGEEILNSMLYLRLDNP